ncbi:uncharacterized protein LOC126266512 isoform X2 [Aethina tumida]|uniref:uncharacterized protein LOC126266512 isoform X2 n=1 Tax=Aethina tumida TaxID=116153 RepID=UPI002147E3C3|nr:uncharacterized protein LOC126266512 isoform X2 [Aethina tumida]
MRTIFVILVLLQANIGLSFKIITNNSRLDCTKTRVICIDDSSFTTCSVFMNSIILSSEIINCPPEHICRESSNDPCIRTEVISTKESSKSVRSFNTEITIKDSSQPRSFAIEITQTDMTTETAYSSDSPDTKNSETPKDKPQCYQEGNLPGKTCNTYYKCVFKITLFFFGQWSAEEEKCDDNQHFDKSLSKCVEGACK